jgi:exopolysaccharide biosynthesis polyprenyl glycosylphosphotransferase
VAKVTGLYDRDQYLLHKTTLDEIPSLFTLATLSTLVLFLAGDVIATGRLASSEVFALWGALFAALTVLRALARWIAASVTPPERCLFVGSEQQAADFAAKLAASRGVQAELVGRLGADESGAAREPSGELSAMLPALKSYLATEPLDRVVLSPGSEAADDLMYAITELKSYGVKVSVLTAMSRAAGSSVELDTLGGTTLLALRRFEITTSSGLVKRGFDVGCSAFALLALAPVLLAIAIAIKLDSPGPVLFRQRRVGRGDEVFGMLKFRSMVENAEELKDEYRHLDEGEGIFKIADDPRVTRVGRFIRRWALDELPQLVNVLRNEMSLVGPRPLPLDEDAKIVGWYRRRLGIAPGITGYWQTTDTEHSLTEMVRLDCLYLANWSLWNDVRILLRTIPHVLRQKTP